MVLAKYNNQMMQTAFSGFDKAMEMFCALNIVSVAIDLFYFKYFLA